MLNILDILKPTAAPLRPVEPVTPADEHILVLLVQERKGTAAFLLKEGALPRITTPIGADADEAAHTAETELAGLLGPKARLEGAVHLSIARKKERDVQVLIAQVAGGFTRPTEDISFAGERAFRNRGEAKREDRQLLRLLFLKGYMPGGPLFSGWQSEWQPLRDRAA